MMVATTAVNLVGMNLDYWPGASHIMKDENGFPLVYNPVSRMFEYPIILPDGTFDWSHISSAPGSTAPEVPVVAAEPFVGYSREGLEREARYFVHSIMSGGNYDVAERRFAWWTNQALEQISNEKTINPAEAKKKFDEVYSVFKPAHNPLINKIKSCSASASATALHRIGMLLARAAYPYSPHDDATFEKFLSLGNIYLKRAVNSGNLQYHTEEIARNMAQDNDLVLQFLPCNMPPLQQLVQTVQMVPDIKPETPIVVPQPQRISPLLRNEQDNVQQELSRSCEPDGKSPINEEPCAHSCPVAQPEALSVSPAPALPKQDDKNESGDNLCSEPQKSLEQELSEAVSLFGNKQWQCAIEKFSLIADRESDDVRERSVIAEASRYLALLYGKRRIAGSRKKKNLRHVEALDPEKSKYYLDRSIKLGSHDAVMDYAMMVRANGDPIVAGQIFEQISNDDSMSSGHRGCAFFMRGVLALTADKKECDAALALECFKKASISTAGFLTSYDTWSPFMNAGMFEVIDTIVPAAEQRVRNALVRARDENQKVVINSSDVEWLYIAGRICDESDTEYAQKRRAHAFNWIECAAQAGYRPAMLRCVLANNFSKRDRVFYLIEAMTKSSELSSDELRIAQEKIVEFALEGYLGPIYMAAECTQNFDQFLKGMENKFPRITFFDRKTWLHLIYGQEKSPEFYKRFEEYGKTSWVARVLADCFVLADLKSDRGDQDDLDACIKTASSAVSRLSKETETYPEVTSALAGGYTILAKLHDQKRMRMRSDGDHEKMFNVQRKLVYGYLDRAAKLGDEEAMVLRAKHHFAGEGYYAEDTRKKGCELLERVIRGDGERVSEQAVSAAIILARKHIEWGNIEKAENYYLRARKMTNSCYGREFVGELTTLNAALEAVKKSKNGRRKLASLKQEKQKQINEEHMLQEAEKSMCFLAQAERQCGRNRPYDALNNLIAAEAHHIFSLFKQNPGVLQRFTDVMEMIKKSSGILPDEQAVFSTKMALLNNKVKMYSLLIKGSADENNLTDLRGQSSKAKELLRDVETILAMPDGVDKNDTMKLMLTKNSIFHGVGSGHPWPSRDTGDCSEMRRLAKALVKESELRYQDAYNEYMMSKSTENN